MGRVSWVAGGVGKLRACDWPSIVGGRGLRGGDRSRALAGVEDQLLIVTVLIGFSIQKNPRKNLLILKFRVARAVKKKKIRSQDFLN
jgi:hypothetical protein